MFVTASKQDQIKNLVVKIGEVWPRNIEDEAKRDTLRSWTRRLKTFDDGFVIFLIKSAHFMYFLTDSLQIACLLCYVCYLGTWSFMNRFMKFFLLDRVCFLRV